MAHIFVHAAFFHENSGDLTELTAQELEVIPAEFLGECYRLTQRRMAALACFACKAASEGKRRKDIVCSSRHHNSWDIMTPRERDWCWLHEHEDNAEALECGDRLRGLECRFKGFGYEQVERDEEEDLDMIEDLYG